jgi:hypothetical protein
MSPLFYAWARLGKNWRIVGVGSSATEAHRELLTWVMKQARPPVASAVLPVGSRPEAQDERHGPSARRRPGNGG